MNKKLIQQIERSITETKDGGNSQGGRHKSLFTKGVEFGLAYGPAPRRRADVDEKPRAPVSTVGQLSGRMAPSHFMQQQHASEENKIANMSVQLDVEPTALAIDKAAAVAAELSRRLQEIAVSMRESNDLLHASEAAVAIAEAVPRFELDVLIGAPLQQFKTSSAD